MVDIYLKTYLFIFGALLIVFNKNLVKFQLEIQKERSASKNADSLKMQFYILGIVFLILGLWQNEVFGK